MEAGRPRAAGFRPLLNAVRARRLHPARGAQLVRLGLFPTRRKYRLNVLLMRVNRQAAF